MKATVTSIKRFAVHDGDGIRTTVFLKGCPLRCIWCHNPETLSPARQIALYAEKCIGCQRCASLCTHHAFHDAVHTLDREGCTLCGACAEVCPKEAIEIIGREMTPEEVFEIVKRDKPFYDGSGGGLTLSGGECLLQPDFCRALLSLAREAGIHTAVDTCGFVSRASIDAVLPYTNIFLYDIKALDEERHILCTGRSSKPILENLAYLDKMGKAVEIRIPYVPDCNSGEMPQILEYLKHLHCVKKIRVLPYHNYAGSKYEALSMSHVMPKKLPTEEEICLWQERADAVTRKNTN